VRRARLKALLVFTLVIPALGIIRVEALSSPTLSVRLGYQGVVRAAEWMPVDIQVATSGAPVDGILELAVQDSSEGYVERQHFTSQPNPFGPTYTTAYDLPVQLAPGSSAHLRTFLLTDVQNPTISVRLIESGRTVAGPTTAGAQTSRLLVGVLARRPAAFDALATLHLPGNLTPRVVALRAADLPESAVLLRAFDLIVIDDFPARSLTKDQQTALADYVSTGGSLVLGTGAASPATWQELPSSLLPMEIHGMATLSRVAALPGVSELNIVTGTPQRGGRVWVEESTRPLLVEWPVGGGVVTFAAFSFTAPPIADWKGTRALLRQIVIRSALRWPQSGAAPASLTAGYGPIWGPLGFQGSVTKRSWFLMPDLGRAPGLNLPSLRLLGVLVAGYALLIGSVSFLLLWRARRPAWLWLTAAVVALLPVGVFWVGSARGLNMAINQFSVTYLAEGWPTAYRETFTAIRPSGTGNYRVAVPRSRVIAPFAVGYGPADAIGVGIRVDTKAHMVDLLQVSRSSLRGYATETTVPAPGLTAQLTLLNGSLKGHVKNSSSEHFIDAVLLAGTSIIQVGDLPPGRTVPIEAPLATTTATNSGTLTSLQIYPNSFSGTGPSGPLKGDGRISLLQLILGEYDTQSAQFAPTLLAWALDEVEPITIDSSRPRLKPQNAIVMPLAISQVTGALPAGFVAPRLVDATGHVALDQYGAAVDNGSVTYEFSLPLPAGAGVSQLSIHHLLPVGPFPATGLVGPGGRPVAAITIWDWSRSAWIPITLVNSGAAPIPDATLQPGTGLVRLRVESVAGASFRLGSLWLEGSVVPIGS